MAETKIRVGVIGANARYGWGMRAHLPTLLSLPEFELKAVGTAHPETAEESAKQYGASLAFHDYQQMVTHPEIDLVSVAVKVPWHYGMVTAALGAGKHVYCEWPLGANLGEAEEMAALANSKGVKHLVGLQARCDPALLRLQELLSENYLGEVLACNMTMFLPGLLQRGLDRAWMADRDQGANTLTIATGHAIDVLCFCVGEFQEVLSQVTTQVPAWDTSEPGKTVKVTAADNVLVSGVLTNGAIASVHVSTVPWHGSGWRMEVYGREGSIVASSREMVQYAQIRLQGGLGQDGNLAELPISERLTWIPGEVPQGAPFNVAQMFRKLGQGILEGNAVEPDFDLAVKRHQLLDIIQRSSDQGMKQRVT